MKDQSFYRLSADTWVRIWKRGKQPMYSAELFVQGEMTMRERNEFENVETALDWAKDLVRVGG